MKKDYKVEMKPTIWQVKLSHGCYSDYSEEHLFFAGNNEDEIWLFLCRYIEDIAKESDYLCGGYKLALKYGDKKYLSTKYKGDIEDIYWSSVYDINDVEINRLNVIYFKN